MDEPDPAPPAADPELEPLLDFAPVPRRTTRSDGWPPERQRDFVAALARLGKVNRAAQEVGRTESGAYKVRDSAGAEAFAAAWDGALALYHARNPKPARVGRPSRGERLAMSNAAPPEPEEEEDEDDEAADAMLAIFDRYRLKLADERRARLAGRIAEADFYVRQLSFIELILDLGGGTQNVLGLLGCSDRPLLAIVATPMSVLLDKLRRDYWAEGGEPERPPLGELGEHDDQIATGPVQHYNRAREGVGYEDWGRRRDEAFALAAQAQAAWEDKARAYAARWRARIAEKDEEPRP